jgi:hypothetical protein
LLREDDLGRDGAGFEHADAHARLGDLLPERFGEAVHSWEAGPRRPLLRHCSETIDRS